MPADVAGTSIETLSVSISNRLSPGFTASPADLNHLVILPSLTVSPSCGIRTSILLPHPRMPPLLDPLPDDFLRRTNGTQDQAVACEFVASHDIAGITRLDARVAVMGHGLPILVDRVGAEIGDAVPERIVCLLGCGLLASSWLGSVGRDVHGHVAARVIHDDTLGIGASTWPRL